MGKKNPLIFIRFVYLCILENKYHIFIIVTKPDSTKPQHLTYWGRDKMAPVSQTTLSNAFLWMKISESWIKFHWSSFLMVLLKIFQYWFWWWLGADQATSHYLNQWWLDHWRIFASLGLNELSCFWKGVRVKKIVMKKSLKRESPLRVVSVLKLLPGNLIENHYTSHSYGHMESSAERTLIPSLLNSNSNWANTTFFRNKSINKQPFKWKSMAGKLYQLWCQLR